MKVPISFTHHQVVVQFRVPIYEDGSAGQPEVVKKFVTEFKDTRKAAPKPKPTKPEIKPLHTEGFDEDYM